MPETNRYVTDEADRPKVDEARLRSTTDAAVWAEEFAKVYPEVDQGLMIGWFANAMETAKTLSSAVDWDEATFLDACVHCGLRIRYITCPTGGWWKHEVHPADGHDALPKGDDNGCFTLPDGTCVGSCTLHGNWLDP